MNHRTLADKFAHGATKGKASNMFIEGDVIYSYGRHFPIAKRINGMEFLFNDDSYSVSTSNHQSIVMSALCFGSVWRAPKAAAELIPGRLLKQTLELHKKILGARTKMPFYLRELEYTREYWAMAKKRFRLKSEDLDFELQFEDKTAIKIKIVTWRFEQAAKGVA